MTAVPPDKSGLIWSTGLLLAAAYVVSGKLSLLLALPPGYASAIFPPAGIAVAAALIGGGRTLPWIFLGSLSLNAWVGYSASGQVGPTGLVVASVIAMASMLQAAAGGWWLRRMVGYPVPLDDSRDILRFLLSAPLICLVSASLSVSGLFAFGMVGSAGFAVSWATWWVGDTLGVVVMLPLVMVVAGEPRALWRGRLRTVALPMVLVFAFIVVIFFRVNQWERDEMQLVSHARSQSSAEPADGGQYRSWQSWSVLSAGILGTGLLGALLLLGTGHAARVEAEVKARTRELKENQDQLHEITANLGEGVYVMNAEGRITFTNPEAQRLLGWTEDELIGQDAHRLFHYLRADHAPHPVEECRIVGVMRSGETYRSDAELFWRKDGTPLPVEVCSSPIGRDGGLAGSVTVFRDITERKRADEALREQKEFLNTILESEPECVKVVAVGGRLLQMNRAGLAMLEVDTLEEAQQLGLSAFILPGYRDAFLGLIQRVFKGETGVLEFPIQGKRGTPRWLETHATPLRDAYGRIVALVGVTRDITEHKRAAEALRESEARFRDTLEYAPIGMAIVSLDGRFLQVNRALCNIVGYEKTELEQLTAEDITYPEDMKASLANMRCVEDGEAKSFKLEERYFHKDGRIVWIQLSSSLLRDAAGAPLYFIAQIEDISERKSSHERIHHLAYYDILTDLPNRRLLMDRLNQAIAQAQRYKRSLAVMFLDLDHFKEINDRLGHDVGDELLKVVAARLSACVRSADTLSRQGGDEFVIVLAEMTQPKDAELVADKILKTLADPIAVRDHQLRVTTSIGIAVYSADRPEDAQELMKKADMAMYAAKEAGRNQYRFCRCPNGYSGTRCRV